MKNLKVIGLTLLSISIMSGCASTDDSLPKDATGNFVFPSMKPIKNEPYVWDDSISEALNVARIAQPAGVGNGMRDYANGENASIGLKGAIDRIFDGSLGLLTSGGFGLVQAESLNNGVNRAVDWKPTVVDIVDKYSISENGEISFVKTRNYIAAKIRKAIEKDYADIEWGDTLTLKRLDFKPELWQVVKGEICNDVMSFDVGGTREAKLISNTYSDFFYEGKNKSDTYCSYTMSISVSYTDANSVMVVAESKKGHFLDKSVALNYDGYVLIPDIYFANVNYKVVNPYAYVMKSGKQLLFQKP